MATYKPDADDKLAPYALVNVEGLEEGAKKIEELDSGAYGIVFKVTVNGLPYMAKRLHGVLVKEVSDKERRSMAAKFRDECLLLSQLCHPNIIRFVGVCYGRSKSDLTLIMDRLYTDVSAFVRTRPNIPISIKASILLDVSYGLLYLNGQTPPIVHRDLTAPNILLTSDFRAKIADLGVSKMLDNPQLVTQTVAPGNIYYMAPETKIASPLYGTAVDIFSFGHLVIHLSIQDWPKVYECKNVKAMEQGVMEIAKRESALEENMGPDHPLRPIALQCLKDEPNDRPSIAELSKVLADLCIEYPKMFDDIVQVTDEVEKSHLVGEHTLPQDQDEIQELDCKTNAERLEDTKLATTEKEMLLERNERLEAKYKALEVQYTAVSSEKSISEKALETTKEQLAHLRMENQDNRKQLETTIRDTSRLSDDVLAKTQEAEQYKKRSERYKAKFKESSSKMEEREAELEQCREEMKLKDRNDRQTITELQIENESLEAEKVALTDGVDKSLSESHDKIKKSLQEFEERFANLKQRHGPGQRAKVVNTGTDLPGVEVVGQTSLVVSNSAKTFQWKGYGFNLHVPADSLPADVDSCVLHVYASTSGQYQFPDNQELVSAVYWVRCEPPCQFKQQLAAEFQHCAKKAHSNKLTFVRAVCSQKVLPYTFKKVEGRGTFTVQSSYGTIQLDHFSGFAVTGDGPIERLYTAGLYYLGRDVRSWEIHLVVTWDDEPHVTSIRQHYKEERAVRGPFLSIEFEGEKIELNIPMEGIPIGEWRIRPLVLPMLAQKRVDYFKPGRQIPCCQLTAKFLQQGASPEPIPELYHLLSLKGAKEPNNVITIEIDPIRTLREQAQTRATPSAAAGPTVTLDQLLRHTGTTEDRIDLECTNDNLSKIVPHLTNWFKYAKALKLTDLEIQEIRTDLLLDATMKAHKALQRWHQVNGFQATYRRLIEVCLEHRDVLVAEEICKLLI